LVKGGKEKKKYRSSSPERKESRETKRGKEKVEPELIETPKMK
jgi:hypothetical protein